MTPRRLLVTALACAFAATSCEERPAYVQSDIDAHRMLDGLDSKFMLGAATAPHQVEGGLDDLNDWGAFSRGVHGADHPKAGRPNIVDQRPAGRAADSWNKWQDDIAALKKLGANSYRMGIEWSRIEPTKDTWDDAAIAHYKQILADLKTAGIKPVVTLCHFTLPLWLATKNKASNALEWESGGWEDPAIVTEFEQYATKLGQEFGGDIDWWITINEINVFVAFGWATGDWPPGVRNQQRMANAFVNLLKGHAAATRALRTADTTDADGDGKATQVGIAHHYRIFEAGTWSTLDGVIAGLTEQFFNWGPTEGHLTGHATVNIPPSIAIDEEVPDLKGSFDFIGLNFYSRYFVRTDLGDPTLSKQYFAPGTPRNDLGWEIYAEGFERVIMRLHARYGLPILVTENGVSDFDDDTRGGFLRAHLYALDRARARGASVIGYLHWSLVDNYEWAEGYTAPFGLFHIDFFNDPDLKRVPTKGVAVFQEAARNIGLTPVD